MKYSKNLFFILIVFCSFYFYGMAESKVFRVSGKAFGVFSVINNSAEIRIYTIKKDDFELTDTFRPTFLKNKELIVETTTPMGDSVKTFRYEIIGVSGDTYYFRVNTHELLEYNKYSHSVVKRFFDYPKILTGVYKSDNYFILFSSMVLDDRSKSECRDKYFILKTLDWKDYKCFGKCKNLMIGFDFPNTFVFENGNSVGVYFSKTSEMRIYDVLSQKLSKTFKVLRNHKVLKNKPGKLESMHKNKNSFCLIKIMSERTLIFKIGSNEWKLAQEIKGKYKNIVLLDTHIVLTDGDEIDTKKLSF